MLLLSADVLELSIIGVSRTDGSHLSNFFLIVFIFIPVLCLNSLCMALNNFIFSIGEILYHLGIYYPYSITLIFMVLYLILSFSSYPIIILTSSFYQLLCIIIIYRSLLFSRLYKSEQFTLWY